MLVASLLLVRCVSAMLVASVGALAADALFETLEHHLSFRVVSTVLAGNSMETSQLR